MRIFDVQRLHQPLERAGLLPPHCRLLEVRIGISGGLVATYEVFLDDEQTVALGKALLTVAEAPAEAGVK